MSADIVSPAERSARTGFAEFHLNRRAEWRDNAARIEAMFDAPDALTTVTANDIPILLERDGITTVWHRPADMLALTPALERVFLGTDGDAPRFGIAVAPEFSVRPDPDHHQGLHAGHVVMDLRSIAMQGKVPPDELACVGAGKALVDWHLRHRFCARCGQPTIPDASGWRRDCPSCTAQHFPRTDPVAIMLAVRGDHCLLARQPRFQPGMYSCLAGFIEPGESLEDAVRRETLEEAGIRTGRVRYLATQPWPFPSSLMIGCLAEALNEEIVLEEAELESGRWFSRNEVLAMMKRQHPDGLWCPPRMAIANTLIRAWASEGEVP
jgi:NAD+ diphosphatase